MHANHVLHLTVMLSAILLVQTGVQLAESDSVKVWTAWSPCSTTCGQGISTRKCQDDDIRVSKTDTATCNGTSTQVKVCSLLPCPRDQASTRQTYCSLYNSRKFSGRQYVWEPFIHLSDSCKLACRARGEHFYANLPEKAEDGTPCKLKTVGDAVCVGGVCKQVGCDAIVESEAAKDVCGVCKGDGSSCQTISGIFTSTHLKPGVNYVISIPGGSTSINITELRASKNFLILQTVDGRYIINNDTGGSSTTAVEAAGTTFTHGAKISPRRKESITAPGPTNITLVLKILIKGRNPGILYSFSVPRDVGTAVIQQIRHRSWPIEIPPETNKDLSVPDSRSQDRRSSPINHESKHSFIDWPLVPLMTRPNENYYVDKTERGRKSESNAALKKLSLTSENEVSAQNLSDPTNTTQTMPIVATASAAFSSDEVNFNSEDTVSKESFLPVAINTTRFRTDKVSSAKNILLKGRHSLPFDNINITKQLHKVAHTVRNLHLRKSNNLKDTSFYHGEVSMSDFILNKEHSENGNTDRAGNKDQNSNYRTTLSNLSQQTVDDVLGDDQATSVNNSSTPIEDDISEIYIQSNQMTLNNLEGSNNKGNWSLVGESYDKMDAKNTSVATKFNGSKNAFNFNARRNVDSRPTHISENENQAVPSVNKLNVSELSSEANIPKHKQNALFALNKYNFSVVNSLNGDIDGIKAIKTHLQHFPAADNSRYTVPRYSQSFTFPHRHADHVNGRSRHQAKHHPQHHSHNTHSLDTSSNTFLENVDHKYNQSRQISNSNFDHEHNQSGQSSNGNYDHEHNQSRQSSNGNYDHEHNQSRQSFNSNFDQEHNQSRQRSNGNYDHEHNQSVQSSSSNFDQEHNQSRQSSNSNFDQEHNQSVQSSSSNFDHHEHNQSGQSSNSNFYHEHNKPRRSSNGNYDHNYNQSRQSSNSSFDQEHNQSRQSSNRNFDLEHNQSNQSSNGSFGLEHNQSRQSSHSNFNYEYIQSRHNSNNNFENVDNHFRKNVASIDQEERQIRKSAMDYVDTISSQPTVVLSSGNDVTTMSSTMLHINDTLQFKVSKTEQTIEKINKDMRQPSHSTVIEHRKRRLQEHRRLYNEKIKEIQDRIRQIQAKRTDTLRPSPTVGDTKVNNATIILGTIFKRNTVLSSQTSETNEDTSSMLSLDEHASPIQSKINHLGSETADSNYVKHEYFHMPKKTSNELSLSQPGSVTVQSESRDFVLYEATYRTTEDIPKDAMLRRHFVQREHSHLGNRRNHKDNSPVDLNVQAGSHDTSTGSPSPYNEPRIVHSQLRDTSNTLIEQTKQSSSSKAFMGSELSGQENVIDLPPPGVETLQQISSTFPNIRPMTQNSRNELVLERFVGASQVVEDVDISRETSLTIHSLVYEWKVSGLTQCTHSCGGGIQQTVVVCVDTITQAVVTDENCRHFLRPKLLAVPCNTRPCSAEWVPGPWSSCSVSCGTGEESRILACQARVSPTLNMTMPDSTCEGQDNIPARQTCSNGPCSSWQVGSWSNCSTSCGDGHKSRSVNCVDANRHMLSDNDCTEIKPHYQEPCNLGECGQGWFFTEWSQECSSECGAGVVKRQVFCANKLGTALVDNRCDTNQRPPAIQSCRASKPCGALWYAGHWSQCDVTCGSGSRRRHVVCVEELSASVFAVVGDSNCTEVDKPAETEPCQLPPCASKWYMTSWSRCSKSCDTGSRTREVRCLDPDHNEADDCPMETRPRTRESCHTHSCSDAITADKMPDCTDRFSQCTVVKRARLCRFNYYRKMCCKSCAKFVFPTIASDIPGN